MNENVMQLLSAGQQVMPMSERLAYALRMLVVGLGMVFVVLAILWGVLVLSRIFLHDMPKRRKSEASAEAKTVASPTATPAPKPQAPVAPACTNDGDVLVAVITAAVAAAMAEQGNTSAGGFRVVSFRRASGHRAWNGQ